MIQQFLTPVFSEPLEINDRHVCNLGIGWIGQQIRIIAIPQNSDTVIIYESDVKNFGSKKKSWSSVVTTLQKNREKKKNGKEKKWKRGEHGESKRNEWKLIKWWMVRHWVHGKQESFYHVGCSPTQEKQRKKRQNGRKNKRREEKKMEK